MIKLDQILDHEHCKMNIINILHYDLKSRGLYACTGSIPVPGTSEIKHLEKIEF